MAEADWSGHSLLTLIAAWQIENRHKGSAERYISLAGILEKTASQEPHRTANLLKALGDARDIRVVGAADFELLGVSRSQEVLLQFKRTIKELSVEGKSGEQVIADFRQSAPRLARRQLTTTLEPAAAPTESRARSRHLHIAAAA